MRRTYLLAAVVLIVCLSSLAQSPKEKVSPVPSPAVAPADAKTPDPKADQDQNLTNQVRDLLSQVTPLDLNSDHAILISPEGLDGACFTIRSYVVARDSKDSEATHLVHTSTCQPASRYHFRSAELRQETPRH
jgi:hypothetical protein